MAKKNEIPMMVVASKAKAYLNEAHGIRIGADALAAVNRKLQAVLDEAAAAATNDGRQTIKERDITL